MPTEITTPPAAAITGTAPANRGATEDADAPFGQPGHGRWRLIRRAMYIGVPFAVLVGVYLATRGADESAETAGHNHGAAPTADSAQPVRLSDAEARRIGVTYAAATIGPVEREIRTVGQVTFDETRVKTVTAKIDGWVERLYVDFTGQAVLEGAPLFAVYSPMLVTAQEELLLARRLEADVVEGSADVRANAAGLVGSARRRLAFWDIPAADIARIERTGEVERTLTLRAAVGGFVVEKYLQEGQRIMAGELLYRIADLSTLWVEGDVYEQDLQAVRLGQPAEAALEAFPGETFTGRVTYVYPTVDPDTRTVRVRVSLPNPRLLFKPGMYATLRLSGTGRASVLTIPRSAVLSTGERHLVFVKLPDGALEPRVVQIGMRSTDRVEVASGLAEGDIVVASATFLLDAESNLGTLLRGMGTMPGMDVAPAGTPAPPPGPAVDHSKHEE